MPDGRLKVVNSKVVNSKVVNSEADKRYEAWLGGILAGFSQYRPNDQRRTD